MRKSAAKPAGVPPFAMKPPAAAPAAKKPYPPAKPVSQQPQVRNTGALIGALAKKKAAKKRGM